jgi:uncharacterized protein
MVLDGFPSLGLVNAIAAECLIRSAGTELLAIIDSPEFPPLSIINNFKPQFPARLHINEDLKVAFFISEFSIHPAMQSNMARTILNWALENECKLIISAAGIVGDQPKITGANDAAIIPDEQPVFAVANTTAAGKIIRENGFIELRSGLVKGIPATLLNEGGLRGQDVIVLMVNTMLDAPDFRAAALVSNAVTKLVPGLSCDIGSLIAEAQVIENKMKQIRDEHKESYIA